LNHSNSLNCLNGSNGSNGFYTDVIMKLTIPDLIINTLSRLEVDHLFHLPGFSLSSFYHSLSLQKKIHSVLFKHEQAACFAAAGYSLVTNKPGVCMVMGGPGVTNLISAATECYYQSIPLVIITVDNPHKNLGREAFHEVDSFSMLTPITKEIICPERASNVQEAVAHALKAATSGRPGPVYLNLPLHLMEQSATIKDVSLKEINLPTPSSSQIKKALTLIKESKQPVIFAGSGVIRSGAERELAQFIKLTGIPAFTSLGGRGALPESMPLVMGMFPYNFDVSFLSEADLFIVLGTRLNQVNVRMGGIKISRKMLRVDIDSENPKYKKADLYLQSDLREFLRSIINQIKKEKRFPHCSRSAIYESYRKAYDAFNLAEYRSIHTNSKKLTSQLFLLELKEFLETRDATLFTDTVLIPYTHLFPRVKKPRSFFSLGSFGCLGFSLPAALGAAIAARDRKVISLSGDGAFLFNCQELSTAATYGLENFIQIVLNNSGYSSLHNLARKKYNRQEEFYHWSRIDYHRFAESLGVKAMTVDSPAKITQALKRIFSTRGPHLLNVVIHRKAT